MAESKQARKESGRKAQKGPVERFGFELPLADATRFRSFCERRGIVKQHFSAAAVLRALDALDPHQDAIFLANQAIRRLGFYYGASESAPGDAWIEDFRAVFGFLLTGEGEPAWHREIYRSLRFTPEDRGSPISLELGRKQG